MTESIRNLLFKIFKKNSFPGKIIDKFITKEILRYLIFGVLTTLVNYIATILLSRFVFTSQESGQFTLCNALAWAVSVLFAFFTNKLFVFESKSFAPAVFAKEFISFTAARAVSGIIEIFMPEILMRAGLDRTLFGVRGMLAKLAVSIFVIIFNYVFSKLVSFRKKKNEDKSDDESNSGGAQ